MGRELWENTRKLFAAPLLECCQFLAEACEFPWSPQLRLCPEFAPVCHSGSGFWTQREAIILQPQGT